MHNRKSKRKRRERVLAWAGFSDGKICAIDDECQIFTTRRKARSFCCDVRRVAIVEVNGRKRK